MIFNLSVSSNRYVIGASGGIRTPDLEVRSLALYPTKLQTQILEHYYYTVKNKIIQEKIKKLLKKLANYKNICYIPEFDTF